MDEREIISVLNNKSSCIYGYPLTVRGQVQLYYIIPGISFLIIFVLNFSLDVGIGIDLLIENKILYGIITLVLIYIPPAVHYIQQVFHPPSPRSCKLTLTWLIKETLLFIFFPYRIIKCLGEQVFWIIEIILNKEDPEDSLLGYENCFTESVENYLFLQIFLQNIPQALLQLHLLDIGISTHNETDVFQAFCAVVSLLMAATNIMRLHRYESQRIGGRKSIWKVTPTPTPQLTLEQNEIPLQESLIPKQNTGLRLPTRRPRIKALEEDNPIGKLFLFLFWFMFLLGRTVTITTAAKFYPKIVAGIICIHALIMFMYYVWYPVKFHKKLFLVITSIFFILEVGIKIQKIGYLYLLFIVTTVVEDIGLTISWYIWGKWRGWWYNYVIYVDINSHILLLIFFTLYLAFFKPKVKYIRQGKSVSSNRSSTATA